MSATPRQVKAIRWMMFGVVLSLLPIGASYLGAAAFGKTPDFVKFLGRGDLLLVSATIGAAAAGELFGSRTRAGGGLEVFMAGLAIAVAVLAALLFGVITTAKSLGELPAEGFIAACTTVLFLVGVASGVGCVALSER
jgi:hypothetical protein